MKRWATIDPTGLYRLDLGREPDDDLFTVTRGRPSTLLAVMLNPSKADGREDDPTIRVLLGVTERWGHQALVVTNLFAYRATDPADLWACACDRVGPDNDAYIARHAAKADRVLVAWGSPACQREHRQIFEERVQAVLRILGDRPLLCMATTKDGQPHHPLRTPAGAPALWKPPRRPLAAPGPQSASAS